METKTEAFNTLFDEHIKKSGPQMTHLVTVTGDGNMQTGFIFCADYFHSKGIEKGKRIGTRSGFIKGAVVTSGLWGAVFITKKIIEQIADKKKQEAINNFKKEYPKCEKTTLADDETATSSFSQETDEANGNTGFFL